LTQRPHEVALAEGNTFGSQDVVGGSGVEIKIGQGKGHQKPFGRKEPFDIADSKDHVGVFVAIDLLGRELSQGVTRIGNQGL
jgi:hypothetical protein